MPFDLWHLPPRVERMGHKIKKGDEIQACGQGQPWVIGTFVSYRDGKLTLDGVVPLYGKPGAVYVDTPTRCFAPTSVFIYGAGEKPIFTWNIAGGDLAKSIDEG